MMSEHVTWSGAAYSFSGAGAYVGMASCEEHYSVARVILPRQGWVYPGGGTKLVKVLPTVYFAVRDPSAVRIVPVADRRNRVRKHVLLGFDGGKKGPHDPAVPAMEQLKKHCDEKLHGVFIVTVGLPVREESRFFRSVVLACEGREFGRLCEEVQQYRPEGK